MKKESVAVVIITNGPGELSTWVKPVIDKLNQINVSVPEDEKLNFSLRLILVPCPNGTGKEYQVADSWKEFDLITKSKHFLRLLFKPSTIANWPKKGVVIFLGGDQVWSVLLAKRLGYINITYAEWVARWPMWTDIIAAMNWDVKKNLANKYKRKCKIIGDLMADIKIDRELHLKSEEKKWIVLLPGSKKAKLSVGIPFFLEVADQITEKNNNIRLIIPVAPTTNKTEFLFFQSSKNPIAASYDSKIKKIEDLKNSIFDNMIETTKNTKIYLINKHPCYDILKNCDLAITTVGANTAELASVAVPMIVVLPTQHLDVMNAWDGLFGIIGKNPYINKLITLIIKYWHLKTKKFFSWPNIKAKKLIVPERIGNIFPKQIAEEAISLINHSENLLKIKDDLSKQRGKEGATKKLAIIIFNSIKKLS